MWGGGPERVTINEMGEGVLSVFGVAPIVGRDFRTTR